MYWSQLLLLRLQLIRTLMWWTNYPIWCNPMSCLHLPNSRIRQCMEEEQENYSVWDWVVFSSYLPPFLLFSATSRTQSPATRSSASNVMTAVGVRSPHGKKSTVDGFDGAHSWLQWTRNRRTISPRLAPIAIVRSTVSGVGLVVWFPIRRLMEHLTGVARSPLNVRTAREARSTSRARTSMRTANSRTPGQLERHSLHSMYSLVGPSKREREIDWLIVEHNTMPDSHLRQEDSYSEQSQFTFQKTPSGEEEEGNDLWSLGSDLWSLCRIYAEADSLERSEHWPAANSNQEWVRGRFQGSWVPLTTVSNCPHCSGYWIGVLLSPSDDSFPYDSTRWCDIDQENSQERYGSPSSSSITIFSFLADFSQHGGLESSRSPLTRTSGKEEKRKIID